MTSASRLAPMQAADQLRPGLDPLDVSPGLLGFLVVFALVLACLPLFRSLTGKLRGIEHRAVPDAEAEPDAEGDAHGAGGAAQPGDREAPTGDTRTGDDEPGRAGG